MLFILNSKHTKYVSKPFQGITNYVNSEKFSSTTFAEFRVGQKSPELPGCITLPLPVIFQIGQPAKTCFSIESAQLEGFKNLLHLKIAQLNINNITALRAKTSTERSRWDPRHQRELWNKIKIRKKKREEAATSVWQILRWSMVTWQWTALEPSQRIPSHVSSVSAYHSNSAWDYSWDSSL